MNGVGTKAEGLKRLGRAWTPEFVLIDEGLAASHDNDGSAAQLAAQIRSSPVADDLRRLFQTAPEGVLVRSSALDEEMSSRGLQASIHVDLPTFLTVGEALKQVWDHARNTALTATAIPVVIQRWVRPELMGHLSNERHLRPDRRDWVIELAGAETEARTFGVRALRRDRVPLDSVPSSCGNAAELQAVLRRVAGAFTEIGVRYHLEWLWDGAQVWLVQCDSLAELRSTEPRAIGWAQRLPELAVFRGPEASHAAFPKVRCVADYIAAGLPHQDLRVLDDEEVLSCLLAGAPTPALDDDLRQLAESKAVVRTDIRREERDFDVLRARTDAGSTAELLRAFVTNTVSEAVREGIPLADIAFLAHAFVPADAAAWTLSAPNSSQVLVDATFGLPDGLLYYPHDSYAVNLRRPDRVRTQLRCKSRILVSDAAGNWIDERLGAPWDWRPALSDEDARGVARLSKQVADHLGHPVETMFFVRTHTVDGAPSIIPWVHRNASGRPTEARATDSHFPAKSIAVTNLTDVDLLPTVMADAASSGTRVLVRLRPDASVVRSAQFLEGLVTNCQPQRCEIELEGSTLSHIYYELVRRGLRVRIEAPLATEHSDPVAFDKLVRDLIPKSIAERGEKVVAYQASGEELQRLLRKKIIEEAFEVAGAETASDLLEEVGDALDVLSALCALAGTDLVRVLERSEQKRLQRGGFSEGLVLVETQEPSLEEAISGDTSTYTIAPELRADVERERRKPQQPAVVVGGVTLVPYAPADGNEQRIVVDSVEFEIDFTGAGARIRKSTPPDDPDQLSLTI